MDVPNGNGTFPSRDKRLKRATWIPDEDVWVHSVVRATDPDTGSLLVAGDFGCRSQSGWGQYYGSFSFDGKLDTADCSCPDGRKGYACKHVLKACLVAGATFDQLSQ